MKTNAASPSYKRHRYPAEIIAHTVWLYVRFSLSFRDVEELMAVRGVTLSYETVRRWTLKFGQQYANELRHRLWRLPALSVPDVARCSDYAANRYS